MKIALYSHFFYPSIGGCETAADLLATGLAELGHHVCLMTRTPLIDAIELNRNFTIARVDSRESMKNYIKWADIILFKGVAIYGLDLCLRLNKPYVLIFPGPQAVCPINHAWNNGRCTYSFLKCLTCKVNEQPISDNIKSLFRYGLTRFYIQKASANIFISECSKDQTKGIIDIQNSIIIGNPYDNRIFNTDIPIKRNTEGSIVFVGRLVSIKGVELLLNAYALASQTIDLIPLRIIGNGPLLPYLQELSKKLKIVQKVHWLGWKSGSELAEEYSSASVVVVPTICEEFFGIVTIEALGCGSPVLVNNRGALPELVPNKDFCLEPTEKAWAKAMLNIRHYSDDERKKFSNETKKRFSYLSIAQQYSNMLEDTLNKFLFHKLKSKSQCAE